MSRARLYRHSSGKHAIIARDGATMLGREMALVFEADLWMDVAALLRCANDDYGHGLMHTMHGTPWQGSYRVYWPNDEWIEV